MSGVQGAVVDMNFGVNADFRFDPSWGEDIGVLKSGAFTGLDPADRKVLSAWVEQAGAIDVDTVMDLAVRRWNISGASAILGVFETDKRQASWLIVRYGSRWALARCADGFISSTSASLRDILRLIDEEMQA